MEGLDSNAYQAQNHDNVRFCFNLQKYFYSLVIGVKLNMAVCGYRVDHINELKPQVST